MKYISKGIVVEGSTEHILRLTRCGYDFQLTGEQAVLWLNGRLGFAEAEDGNPILIKAAMQLRHQELIETVEDETAGEYRALTRCVIIPAKPKGICTPLPQKEKNLLKWICEAGLRLSMAELVFIVEHGMMPESRWLSEENRQALTEAIYTQETIFDNILEAQMEHASKRDTVVESVMALLKKSVFAFVRCMMKEKFQKLPPALQKQILIRFGASVLSLLLLIIVALLYRDLYLCISFLLFGAVFGVAGGLLLFRSFAGRYVLVEGVCQQVEQTAIRKKTKSIYFTTEPYVVKVRLRHRLKEIAVGDHIAVFVSDN